MTREQQLREIEEAIRAGEQAYDNLKSAKDCLSSAKNWGIWDMLGGGFISSMIKHGKINAASGYVEQAKASLKKFQKELNDVQSSEEFRIEIGNFLTFADFFFDGIIADWMVQSKISDAYNQVSTAMEKVNRIMSDLKQMQSTMSIGDGSRKEDDIWDV